MTGAGSGIGEAAAIALSKEGATIILTGRREEPLRRVAGQITESGGTAWVQPADLTRAEGPRRVGAFIQERMGRLDILVNNAGVNISERSWAKLTPEGIDEVVTGNLTSAFYCVTVALPFMRAQKDGVMIHTASFAGRFVTVLPGAAYTAAKHGVVAMSYSINMQECVNGIRSCVMCPGEVATPLLDKRPVPVSPEDRAKMVQMEDCGNLILYIACLPARLCMNEVVITPTWNRAYVAALQR